MPWKTAPQLRRESAKKAILALLVLTLFCVLAGPIPRLTNAVSDFWETYKASTAEFRTDIKRVIALNRQKPAVTNVPAEYTTAAAYHGLTVYFVDDSGLPMRDPAYQSVAVGAHYRLQPYVPQGYVVDLPVIEGTMPDHALRFTVTYRYVGLSR